MAAPALLALAACLTTGCGQMTMRTWITIVEAESGGYVEVSLPGRPPASFDLLRLQGGFLARVVLNTADLPGPMNGHIYLDDVRMAGQVQGLVGKLCTWNDPAGSSGGNLTVDVLAGTTETDMFLDAKATTGISELLNLPPVDFEESLDLDLGAGFGLAEFLAAFQTGVTDGLFASSSTMSSSMDMMGIQTVFVMETTVTNGATPPVFDADLLEFCGDHFASQGTGEALFYGMNAKSSYLRSKGKYPPADPLVIPLADLDAVPGDVLKLQTVGTFSQILLLKDGTDTKTGAVFSSTDEVLDSSQLFRIPGAINAGPDMNTWLSIVCLWGTCKDFGGDDIPQDFRVDPTRWITVPPGANYLIVAPVDFFQVYNENSGMGFGVNITVNPTG